jgi:flagellar protein FlbD
VITVTRLNGVEYLLNPHLIESIDQNPDTTITLVSGKKIVIKETPQKVLDEIVAYRKRLGISANEE